MEVGNNDGDTNNKIQNNMDNLFLYINTAGNQTQDHRDDDAMTTCVQATQPGGQRLTARINV